MPKLLKTAAAAVTAGALGAAALYFLSGWGIFQALAITLGTTAYHFGARLLSGAAFGRAVKIGGYDSGWFRVRPWEMRLYRLLRVKAWKGKLPTYSPEAFSPRLHSWKEIAVNMCRSELVHEVNILLSFLPVAASLWFGEFWVFLLTSLGGALFDLCFVLIQRYNRGRAAKIASRGGSNHH